MTKTGISAAFSSKASTYDAAATVQKNIADTLTNLLQENFSPSQKERWLDLGSGTGILGDKIRAHFPQCHLIPVDLSFQPLLLQNNHSAVVGDMDALPFLPQSFDGIVSGSALQWSRDIPAVFASLRTLVKAKGLIAVALFKEGTLSTLQELQKEYDIIPPVTFLSAQNIEEIISQKEWTIRAYTEKTFCTHFNSAYHALKSLSAIGATYHNGKNLSPHRLKEFMHHYEQCFPTNNLQQCYHTAYAILEVKE